ncbi:MAG: HD domain-containing phosphohydrolase [Candidatus Acidiferrales bacterium]
MTNGKCLARILIVDDDPAICEMLRLKLRSESYDCEMVSSGEEGLSRLRRESFDLILSDLHMPGISGLDFLQAARIERPDAAFLLVTGEQDVRTAIDAMKKGASDYVVKPFRLDAVLHSVAQALDKKRLELELESYRQRLEEMVAEKTQQLLQALSEVKTTYDETLEALGAALDLRDSATGGHSSRVTHYALKMAEVMGMQEGELREISRGACLHDIGKIGIPDGILLKEGRLTPEEEAVMRTHVLIGYHLVCRIAFLAPAAAIVRAHHERYDGSGYPDRIPGPDIPIGARIFAVADTFDAMTSDRPYRRALPFEDSFKEISSQSGRQFDPEVVHVFLSIPRTILREIQRQSHSNGGIHKPPGYAQPARDSALRNPAN